MFLSDKSVSLKLQFWLCAIYFMTFRTWFCTENGGISAGRDAFFTANGDIFIGSLDIFIDRLDIFIDSLDIFITSGAIFGKSRAVSAVSAPCFCKAVNLLCACANLNLWLHWQNASLARTSISFGSILTLLIAKRAKITQKMWIHQRKSKRFAVVWLF